MAHVSFHKTVAMDTELPAIRGSACDRRHWSQSAAPFHTVDDCDGRDFPEISPKLGPLVVYCQWTEKAIKFVSLEKRL